MCYLESGLGLSWAMLCGRLRLCAGDSPRFLWTCPMFSESVKLNLRSEALQYLTMYSCSGLTKNLNTGLTLSCEWPLKHKTCAYMSCQTAAILVIALFEPEQYTQLNVMHIHSNFKVWESFANYIFMIILILFTKFFNIISYCSQRVRKYSPGMHKRRQHKHECILKFDFFTVH